ncbi:MAG: hypothetical protein ACRCV0_04565 [Brevinema sp.]
MIKYICLIIVITVIAAISSVHAPVGNSKIADIIDKIFNYLGIVAIPIVLFYFQKKNKSDEMKIKYKPKSVAVRIKIITFLNFYKNIVKSYSKGAIENYNNNNVTNKDSLYPHLLKSLEFNSIMKQSFGIIKNEDVDFFNELFSFLNLIKSKDGREVYFISCNFPDRLVREDWEIYISEIDTFKEKFEKKEYDSQILEFIINNN